MNWKDWLHISRNDKIVIIVLSFVIILLITILSLLNHNNRNNNTSINLEANEPSDYKNWKLQLVEQKEEEEVIVIEKYKKEFSPFQAKMKEGETIELNMADTSAFKTIPGVGSGFANRIINYRDALGGYAQIEQLSEVWGLDTYLYSQITPYITLDTKHDSLYINKDSFEELLKHPYLNYKQVMVITDLRERKGAIKSMNRLEMLDEFSRRDMERLSLYISFDE